MNASIYPLVLCGGMGSRLWPLSRVEQPKQFQPVAGKGSLTFFQTTIQRHRGLNFHEPIIVTNAKQGAIVDRQMRELQVDGQVICEPEGRNTGPAVLAAALAALAKDKDARLLVLPSDHIIKGPINDTIGNMVDAADDGRIVVFGITPAYPETGYGYITDGGSFKNYPGLHRVAQFVEKPPLETARGLISTGMSYWASGISLFRADVLVEQFERLDPTTFAAVKEAVDKADTRRTRGRSAEVHLEGMSFGRARNEPTEKIVFERTESIALAPVKDVEWDDVGAWNAVHQISERSADNNVFLGDVVSLDTKNSLVRADDRLVAVIGMDNLVVVDTPDALLVTSRDQAQNVKKIVEHLLEQKRPQVQSHKVRDTSWGQVETLMKAPGCDMRMLTLHPGGAVRINGTGVGPSLLMVLSGAGKYEIDGEVSTVDQGDSLPIAADLALPLVNTSGTDMRMIHIVFPRDTDPKPVAAMPAAFASLAGDPAAFPHV